MVGILSIIPIIIRMAWQKGFGHTLFFLFSFFLLFIKWSMRCHGKQHAQPRPAPNIPSIFMFTSDASSLSIFILYHLHPFSLWSLLLRHTSRSSDHVHSFFQTSIIFMRLPFFWRWLLRFHPSSYHLPYAANPIREWQTTSPFLPYIVLLRQDSSSGDLLNFPSIPPFTDHNHRCSPPLNISIIYLSFSVFLSFHCARYLVHMHTRFHQQPSIVTPLTCAQPLLEPPKSVQPLWSTWSANFPFIELPRYPSPLINLIFI